MMFYVSALPSQHLVHLLLSLLGSNKWKEKENILFFSLNIFIAFYYCHIVVCVCVCVFSVEND